MFKHAMHEYFIFICEAFFDRQILIMIEPFQ